MSEREIKRLLASKFDARHIDAALKHFVAATEKSLVEDWEGVALKAGKFIEAVTKALMVSCGKTIPEARDFKAGSELQKLQQLPQGQNISDTVRIVIPRACVFAYGIVNNRGGRHDAMDIDVNALDAGVVMPLVSWVLAELVRFCSESTDTAAAAALVEGITKKNYPYFEHVDGRIYINAKKLSVQTLALLLMYAAYPKRTGRQDLVDAVMRHKVNASSAATAVHRLQKVIDDRDGQWKLRANGRQEAEEALKKLRSNR